MKRLIKITLAISLIAFVCSNSFATYIRITQNGGSNGYYSTVKSIDDNGNISITCTDPGNDNCPTGAKGQNPIYWTLARYALQQIAGGVTSGSYSSTGPTGITYTVTWTATNAQNATININP